MRLASLILVVLIVLVGAFVTAPWWTFRSLRDAARSEDTPSLAKMIDYDAVRQGMADQLAGKPIEAPPPSIWKDPMAAFKHMFTRPPAPPVETDRYVSARAIAALADGKDVGEPLPPAGKEPFPKIAFWGPDRCRINVSDPADRRRHTEFTFERRGIYTWKLVRIAMPARPVPAAA
jgi:hypothetical protein